MSAAFLNGDASFRPKILEEQAVIDQAWSRLAGLDGSPASTSELTGKIAEQRRTWNDLKGSLFQLTPAESFGQQTDLVTSILELATDAAGSSHFMVEGDLDSGVLIRLMAETLPNLAETMGQGRAVASGIAAKGSVSPASLSQLVSRVDRIKRLERITRHAMDRIEGESPRLRTELGALARQASGDAGGYATFMETRILAKETLDLKASEVFEISTKAIGSVFAFYDAMLGSMDRLLKENVEQARFMHSLYMAGTLLTLLLIAYLFTGFYTSFERSVAALRSSTIKLGDGQLATQVHIDARDEMGEIAASLNLMASSFRQLVGTASMITAQVAAASEELSAITAETNRGIKQQRQETEMLAAAINEMSATAHVAADNASSAAATSNRAQQTAQQGKRVVEEAVHDFDELARDISTASEVIRKLEGDSREIGSVLDVIRGIAEQTNLLALNAAIEAARAGEQGRGFAVVADEVRTLASRTQSSTEAIRNMIERLQDNAHQAVEAMVKSTQRAHESVGTVTEAGAALDSITQAIENVIGQNEQIAHGALEQRNVAEDLNRTVSSMSGISEQNASSSGQITVASAELAKLAEELRGSLSRFRT